MAQWIGLGLGGIKRAGHAPARVPKKLRARRPFRRRKPTPSPEPPPTEA